VIKKEKINHELLINSLLKKHFLVATYKLLGIDNKIIHTSTGKKDEKQST